MLNLNSDKRRKMAFGKVKRHPKVREYLALAIEDYTAAIGFKDEAGASAYDYRGKCKKALGDPSWREDLAKVHRNPDSVRDLFN